MQKLNLNIRKISLLMSLGFLFFSCSQNDNTNSDENNSTTKTSSTISKRTSGKYTGAEIVEGLFFFKNDVADGIPSLAQVKAQIKDYNNYSTVSSSMNELSAITIDYINKKYPNYLNELQATVYSGNLFLIGEALQQTAKYVEQAGLSSIKFQSAFLVGEKIYDNPALRAEIAALDLSTIEGVNKLNQLVSIESGTNINNSQGRCIAVAGALAAVYVGVVAVSIAIAAYSVYFKVVYWGGGSCRMGCAPVAVSNIYVGNGGVEIEREILISEIGKFFKP